MRGKQLTSVHPETLDGQCAVFRLEMNNFHRGKQLKWLHKSVLGTPQNFSRLKSLTTFVLHYGRRARDGPESPANVQIDAEIGKIPFPTKN